MGRAWAWRGGGGLGIWPVGVSLAQASPMVGWAYHAGTDGWGTWVIRVTMWNQGNCAARRCTIAGSGYARAKSRMYMRLRLDRPFMSGKAARRSAESRSLTLAAQPLALIHI